MERKALDTYVKLKPKDRQNGETYVETSYKSLREIWMTQEKIPKETLSEIIMYIKRDWLIKVKRRTGKGKIKKETEFHYRVKAVFGKYYNKWGQD